MNQLFWEAAAWYQGQTLRDRITSWHHVGSPIDEFNVELGRSREERWRKQAGFENDLHFVQRLALDGINLCDFRYFLSESPQVVQQRSTVSPEWLIALKEAFSHSQPPNIKVIPPTQLLLGKQTDGFLYSLEPLISQGIYRLNTGIQALVEKQPPEKPLPFTASKIKAILFGALPEKLFEMLTPTMVLELNVARLLGLLSGETPTERFLSFLERLYQKDIVLTLLQEYPVLARQLVICIENWVNSSLEFLQRLCADWDAICNTFSPDIYPGMLVEVKGNLSDSHRGGSSVMIAKFSSGLQVVYKPKSLTVDVHFQELLSWVNQRKLNIKLHRHDESENWLFSRLQIIPRDTYGWVEFVNYQSCNSQLEVQRFYRRLGGYLALLYVLEATDFHSENLIACGENPVLVDLESLFHPRLSRNYLEESIKIATEYLTDSVLRVGLLPQRLWANSEFEGVDISGIGGEASQVLPKPTRTWEGIATDEMRLTTEESQLEGDQNQPRLNDVTVNILNYVEDITNGFSNIYQLLLKHKDELLTANRLLTQFAEDEVRVVLRPTRTYALLLQESYHPDVLRNALDRDRHFDRLWMAVKHQPYLIEAIAAEQVALWRGDIPIFTTRPTSRDLVACNGQCITNFFALSGMELVQNRLQKLDEQDLQRQLWIIRASLTTVALKNDAGGWKSYRFSTPQTVPDREQILSAASAVGNYLELLALGNQQQATWIGLTLVGGRRWSLLPLGWSLYDGLPGVILFLAYLGEITQDLRYAELAQAGLNTLQNQLQQHQAAIKLIGGFSGWGGVIYTLTHLGMLWEQPELLQVAVSWVEKIRPLIAKDKYFDIVDGAAGCLGSLLSLYRCTRCDLILDTAIECGVQLLKKPWDDTLPQIGFAHGAAGIAWALLELARISKDVRFSTAALQIITYERSHFSSSVSNCFDVRDFAEVVEAGESRNQVSLRTTWCNGAPGIGLGRLGSLRYGDDAQTRTEIYTTINSTLKQGFGLNHCLCHGDLGNLELLLQAREILGDQQWNPQIQSISGSIIESINKYGWLCGVPLAVETPGLMTGLAGIGYGLLRVAEPKRIPSVLMLESPIKVTSSSLVVR
ncbi:MAG: type 2 lanthipeptide synthetase LanM family protein [Nostoc sp. S4]|nr:type 2 lanthipeptide synthetase LanM family protein [Nostoc sp. S4]